DNWQDKRPYSRCNENPSAVLTPPTLRFSIMDITPNVFSTGIGWIQAVREKSFPAPIANSGLSGTVTLAGAPLKERASAEWPQTLVTLPVRVIGGPVKVSFPLLSAAQR